MGKGDRYRIVIIISFFLLVICSLILLIRLWNILSMNPGIGASSGLYLLVLVILILAALIFVFHLLEERQIIQDSGLISDGMNKETGSAETLQEPYKAPFEVDVDEIAEIIVPRSSPKESIEDYAEKILQNLSKHFEFVQGIIYLKDPKTKEFSSYATYAYTSGNDPAPFKIGEGIPGQVAKNKVFVNITDIPEGYLHVQSGLGSSSPGNLLVLPLLLNKETIGIIELASFKALNQEMEWALINLVKIIGNSLVTKLKSARKK